MSYCWLPELVHFVYIRSKVEVIIGDFKKSFFLKHPVCLGLQLLYECCFMFK